MKLNKKFIILSLCLASNTFANSTFQILHSFSEGTGFSDDFAISLHPDSKRLYVSSRYGGDFNIGKMLLIENNPSNNQVIYHYQNKIKFPHGKLAFLKNGSAAYGIAEDVVYKFTLDNDKKNITRAEPIHEFTLENQGGYHPVDGVIISNNEQYLYGITSNGGEYYRGILYRIDIKKDGYPFEVLHSFMGKADGSIPATIAKEVNSDQLYGTTNSAGMYQCGTLFTLPMSANKPGYVATLVSFEECSLGYSQPININFSADGHYLYGINQTGKAYGDEKSSGYIYRLDLEKSGVVINNGELYLN